MRVGKVEGTPQEIRDIFENRGLQLEDYLEKPRSPLRTRWLVVPGAVLAIALILLALLGPLTRTALILLFLLGAGGLVWLAVSAQLRFNNSVATFVIAVGGLVMLLVAAGLLEPREATDVLKGLRGG